MAGNGGACDESMAGPCFIVVTRLGAMFGDSFAETELWVSDGDGSMDTTTCNATHGSPPTDVQPTCPSGDVSGFRCDSCGDNDGGEAMSVSEELEIEQESEMRVGSVIGFPARRRRGPCR